MMKSIDKNIYYELEDSYRGVGYSLFDDGVLVRSLSIETLQGLRDALILKIKSSEHLKPHGVTNVLYQVGFLDNKELKEALHFTEKDDVSKEQKLFLQKSVLKCVEHQLLWINKRN